MARHKYFRIGNRSFLRGGQRFRPGYTSRGYHYREQTHGFHNSSARKRGLRWFRTNFFKSNKPSGYHKYYVNR